MDSENIPTPNANRRKPRRTRTLVLPNDGDDTFQLPSPPSSQINLLDMDLRSLRGSSLEASRTLISPPPEAILRSQIPFSPSLLANSSGEFSASKRKRPAISHSSSTSTLSNSPRPIAETTPNPKPRKQSRRHARTTSIQSIDSDGDIPMDSPTRSSVRRARPLRIVSPAFQGEDEDELDSLSPRPASPCASMSPQTTPTHRNQCSHARSASTSTPTRSRHTPRASKSPSSRSSPAKPNRVLLQSPHVRNLDADYIPPIPLVAEQAQAAAGRRRHSRRSATPLIIPPYEPPKEVFTPPREVILSPPAHAISSRASSSRVSRRSATPRASSPASQAGSTTSKKSRGKSTRADELRHRLKLVVAVKLERPEIDLSLPLPPPSPTDDPILLSGPIEVPSSVERRSTLGRSKDSPQQWKQESSPVKMKRLSPPPQPKFRIQVEASKPSSAGPADVTPAQTAPQLAPTPDPIPSTSQRAGNHQDTEVHFADLPSSSPIPSDSDSDAGDGFYDWDAHGNTAGTANTSTDTEVQPIFAFTAQSPVPGADSWSDSEDEATRLNNGIGDEREGEGDFTGRWRLLTVPTKNDPPSSATRARMDAWGRPISPFPKVKLLGEKARRATAPVEAVDEPADADVEDDALLLNDGDVEATPRLHGETADLEGTSKGLMEAEKETGANLAPAGAFDFDVSFDAEPDSGSDAEEDVQPKPIESGALADAKGAPGDVLRMDEGDADQSMHAVDTTDNGDEEGQQEDEGLEEAEQGHEVNMDEVEEAAVYRDISVPLVDAGDNDDDDDDDSMELVAEVDAPQENPCFSREDQTICSGDITAERRVLDEADRAEEDAVLRAVSREPEPELAATDSRHVQEIAMSGDQDVMVGVETEEEGTTDDELADESLVKITSADPRAAARAAAILKQYDYECFTKIVLQQRRRSTRSPDASRHDRHLDLETPGPSRREHSPALSDAQSISCGRSHLTIEDLTRSSRRRGVSAGGVSKAGSPSARSRTGSPAIFRASVSRGRRSSTPRASIVGDTVYVPGSPATTLPELLHEAEEGLLEERRLSVGRTMGSTSGAEFMEGLGERDPFKTPAPRRGSILRGVEETNGNPNSDTPKAFNVDWRSTGGAVYERPWTREDWKQLDACFTDERIAVAAQMGLTFNQQADQEPEVLAHVDDIRVEDVVNRFVAQLGGQEVMECFGDAWSQEKLLCRVQALQRKQRAGKIGAPSASSMYSRTPSPFAFARRASMEVPDFTPRAASKEGLSREAIPFPSQEASHGLPLRPALPAPTMNGPFQDLPPEKSRKLPATLLAPRYSHLLEEAISVSEQGSSGGHSEPGDQDVAADAHSSADAETDGLGMEVDGGASEGRTIGKRVKNFFISYLPSAPKRGSQPKATKPAVSGLPLPPPELLEKPRNISTPIRPPAPKPTHPKDQVHLHPAPPLPKPSVLPKRVPPKRLIELHPVTPPAEKAEAVNPRPRRSSGGSVKDLIMNFEELEKDTERGKGKGKAVKPMRGFGDLKKGSNVGAKPTWRP